MHPTRDDRAAGRTLVRLVVWLCSLLCTCVATLGVVVAEEPPSGEQLRRDGFDIEIRRIDTRRLGDNLHVGFRLRPESWRTCVRAGLSLWIAAEVSPGDRSREWQLVDAEPVTSTTGTLQFSGTATTTDQVVVFRLIAISNGQFLPPGHALVADQVVGDAVAGGESTADVSNSSTGTRLRLSHVGAVHRRAWFDPSRGFTDMRETFRAQGLLTRRFVRHLDERHDRSEETSKSARVEVREFETDALEELTEDNDYLYDENDALLLWYLERQQLLHRRRFHRGSELERGRHQRGHDLWRRGPQTGSTAGGDPTADPR